MAKKPVGTPFGQAASTKPIVPKKPAATTPVAKAQALIEKMQGRVTSIEATQAAAAAKSAASKKAAEDALASDTKLVTDILKEAQVVGANAAQELADANKFPAAGTLLRYEAGSTSATRTPIYANGKGGEYRGPEDVNPLVPGSTGTTKESERTLAKDTFANTLALAFGTQEATQPWVGEIYNLASGFYNTGSTISESLNLSLYEAKAKGLAPQFTKRFKGVFDLQEKLQKGEAVTVPTIAEFIKTEAAIGDTLREAGLGDIATQDFIGNVIGAGNSILDVGNLISSTFTTIDNAPAALRKTLDTYFPSVDRVSLAKALLTGTEGAAALDKKIKGISVLSAAGSQGISTDLATASDIAARGVDYGQALTGFGQVKELERTNVLAQMQGDTFTQKEAIGLTFEQSQAAKDKAEKIKAAEIAKFQNSSGLAQSALRGQSAKQQI